MPDNIESTDQLVRNILVFDEAKLLDKKFYNRKLSNVRIFTALRAGGEYIFAPGNFVIYKDNDLIKKDGDGDPSGGGPERTLKKFAERVTPHDTGHAELERNFLSLGVQPSKSDRGRVYWIVDRQDVSQRELEEDDQEIEGDPDLSPAEKRELRNARRGQGKFRAGVEARWQGGCAVTGCKQREVLRASHIKPWRQSTIAEKRNFRNGLLLTANLDSLFDRLLISFENDGTIIMSEKIPREERIRIGIETPLNLLLPLSKHEQKFMKWHRQAMRENGNL